MFLSAAGWEEYFEKGYSSVETQQWFFSQLCRSIRLFFLPCHHATFLTLLAIPGQFYCKCSHSLNKYILSFRREKICSDWTCPLCLHMKDKPNTNKISLKEEAFRNSSFGHVMKMHFSCRLRGISRTIFRVGAWVLHPLAAVVPLSPGTKGSFD